MEHWIPSICVYWACFISASLIRSIHRQRNFKPLPKIDPKEMPGMLLSFLGMAIFPLLYTLTDWLAATNYDGNYALGILGAIGMLLSVVIIGKAHKDLGDQWTHTHKQVDHPELITRGIYESIRHPMYTAHFLWGISQALLLWNWIAGFGFLIGFVVFCPLRLKLEEANLRRTFGQNYDQYVANTPRFMPKLW